jgi:hypothetical protein
METHSRAYHGTVWLLRGLGVWLFLHVLLGLASASVLMNHETPEFSFDRLATGETFRALAVPLACSALIWYASAKVGRLLAQSMAWEGPEESGAAPELSNLLSADDLQRWMVGLRRRRIFVIAGFASFFSLVAWGVKSPIIFSRLEEGTMEGKAWLVGLVASPLVLAIAFLGMRCPSCGAWLESSRPRTCRKCGIRLFVD